MKYQKINYDELNAKQKEQYNYQKVSAIFAEYGFVTMLLHDDWNGADFLAVHKDGDVLKIQLKGRMTFDKKYLTKDLHICFRDEQNWYLYPHDEMFKKIESESNLTQTESWLSGGKYSFPSLSEKQKNHLNIYLLVEKLNVS